MNYSVKQMAGNSLFFAAAGVRVRETEARLCLIDRLTSITGISECCSPRTIRGLALLLRKESHADWDDLLPVIAAAVQQETCPFDPAPPVEVPLLSPDELLL